MKILLHYAKKYRGLIVFQLIFATIWVGSQLMIPRLMADKGDNAQAEDSADVTIMRIYCGAYPSVRFTLGWAILCTYPFGWEVVELRDMRRSQDVR